MKIMRVQTVAEGLVSHRLADIVIAQPGANAHISHVSNLLDEWEKTGEMGIKRIRISVAENRIGI